MVKPLSASTQMWRAGLCYLPVCAVSLIYSIIVLVTEKDNKTDALSRASVAVLDGRLIIVIIAGRHVIVAGV